MIAIDTNVLVRLLIRDDQVQSRASLRLFTTEEIYIPDSVLLETEWVLRAAYDLGPSDVCSALRSVCGLPNVFLSNAAQMAQVINWHEAGLDFADAFHLAACRSPGNRSIASLRTFDVDFIKRARKISELPVERA